MAMNRAAAGLRANLLMSASLGALIFSAPALAQPANLPPTPADQPGTTAEKAKLTQASLAADQQQAPQTPPADTSVSSTATSTPSSDQGQIFVTGTRIRRPNLESPLPVTSVGGDEFFQTGNVSVGDLLNELPAIRSTFSVQNSSRFLGTTGLSLLDLRGLGTNRTLVLVNGRRHVPGDGSSGVDINTIPADLIDRVDVVTGGNSAVYGSDAIAGVVNFVLKQDYDGVQIRGQGGFSKYGDLGSEYISALAGKNFADGKGNVAINLEVANQDPAYFGHRPGFWSHGRQFVTVDTDPAGTPNGSDGVPDRIFMSDVRFPFFSNGGGLLFCCQPFGTGTTALPFIFQGNGDLVQQTGQLVGRPGFFNTLFIGGNGSTGLEDKIAVLSPKLQRYSANLLGHFTVSDAFEPFVEAKFVRTKARGLNAGPFFFGLGTTGSPRERFHTDNPFLTPQALATIRSHYGDYYGDYTASGYPIGNGVNDADEFGFDVNRTFTDVGNRDDKLRRDTYRVVGGVRGTFNTDWNYEVSLNYGIAKQRNLVAGNVNVQRFLLSIDAVRDPATGNIVCRSQIDPSAAVPFEFPTAGFEDFAAAQLANDVAQCQPSNVFGEGNLSQAAKNYLLVDTISRQRQTQLDLTGFVSGDTSQFLNLPGGPIGFSLGAEYRRETLRSTQDPLVASGLTFYNALGNVTGIPAFSVKEAFGELRIPILKDLPFAHELTVSGAGRISDYSGKTGTTKAWNLSGEWAPIRDIRFRANVARAVRAPNLTERFSPLSQNFAFIDDPCSAQHVGEGTTNRATNCAAAGVPTNLDLDQQQTLLYLSGGNPDLEAETSKSYTFGGVLQPRFLPGFSVTADYYNITVNNVITAPLAQDIVNACYDLPSIDNPFCALFQRAPSTGGPRGETGFGILNGTLRDVLLNFAKLKVRGIDVEAAYRRQLGGIGRLDTRLTYTHALQNDSFLDPTNPDFADQILLELGDPKDAFNWSTDLTHGKWEFGYKLRYIGHMVVGNYEDWFAKQDRPPQNADRADHKYYPAIWYHDIRVGFNPTNRFNVYFGIDNLTNRKPPLDVSGTGGGSGIYDNKGRFFYAGAVAKF